MSSTEPSVTVPVEEVKSTETPVVDAKVEEPPAVVAEIVSRPVVEAEAEATEPTATEDAAKSESKAEGEPKKDGAKNPNFFVKLFSNLKGGGEKKVKALKSPKKEKKEEVEAAAIAEAPKDVEVADAPVEAAVEVVENVKEADVVPAETTIPEVPVVATEDVKDAVAAAKSNARTTKVARRFSARVGDFFKSKPKTEIATSAKVDEYPPKIDEPERIGPLEDPASEAAEVKEQPGKPVEATAPVVAATA